MVEEGKEGESRKENRKGRVGEWEKGRVGERESGRKKSPGSKTSKHPAPSTKYQAPSTQVNYTIQCPPSNLPEDGSQHITPSGKRASGDECSPGSSL